MEIVLYTIDCPKCLVLESKLNAKEIEYTVCKDVKLMREMKMFSAPNLQVDGKIMDFKEAVNWVNEQ